MANNKYPKATGTVVKGNHVDGIVSMGVKENLNTLSDNTLQGLAIAPTKLTNLLEESLF